MREYTLQEKIERARILGMAYFNPIIALMELTAFDVKLKLKQDRDKQYNDFLSNKRSRDKNE